MFAISISAFALAAGIAAGSSQAEPQPAASATPPALLCATGIGALVTRPTQTTTTCVVPAKRVLIETGTSVQLVNAPGQSYAFTSYPNAEVRIGTALRNIEVDLFPPAFFRSSGAQATGDAGAGLKMLFAETSTWAWGASISGTVPTGTNPSLAPHGLGSVNAGTASLDLNFEGTLGPVFTYAATLDRQSDAAPTAGGAARRYESFVPSLELSASLGGGMTAFAEAWTQTDGEGPASGTHRWLDGGLQKDLGSLQFDLEYGRSNALAPAPGLAGVARRYAGFGISRLF